MTAQLWWALALFGGVVVTATLVNTLAPAHRVRLRRLVILFALYLVMLGATKGIAELESKAWTNGFTTASELFYGYAVVTIATLLVFGVLLPKVGVSPPTIASDLIVGVGFVVATFIVLSNHGLDSTSTAAAAAAASGVLAISMQQTLGNIFGGVALQLDGSIHEGDWIQLENGKQGKVRAIRWRHTLVETRDWSTIVVPNAQLLANNITILGWREGKKTPQRMWVYFNIDFRFAPTRVIQVVMDAINGSPIENVATEPAPSCVCLDFARDTRDSFAYYAVRYWILDLATDDPTNSRVRARIYAGLQRAKIPLAIPATANLIEVHDVEHAKRHQARRHDEHLQAIRGVHLFRALTEDELRTLAEGLIHVSYSVGETITRQGAVAHWLYVLTRGDAEIRTKVDPDGDGPRPEVSKLVATLHAPDFFGEMGLMTGEPRAADVIARTDVDCFRLGRDTFERVLLQRPQIAEELSVNMANRRVELEAARENLDDAAKQQRMVRERERILGGIKSFFGL
jgi:small-conductance mechanosensitive channel/CRP-like cAMP-binding protein